MFRASSDVEYFLDMQGVKWEFTDGVKFSELAPDWEIVNLARETPEVENAILDYLERTQGGSEPPAPILCPREAGHAVADGMQRLFVAKLMEVDTFSAYILPTHTKDATFNAIRFGANSWLHGSHRPAPAWELANIVEHMHGDDKKRAKEISKSIGRPVSVVQAEINRFDCTKRLTAVGFSFSGKRRPKWLDESYKHLPKSDWTQHGKLVASVFEFCEQVNSSNGLSAEVFKAIGETQSVKGVPRAAQYATVIEMFSARPEISRRLFGRTKKDRFDVAIETARGLKTVLTGLRREGETTTLDAWVADMAEIMRVCNRELRKICPDAQNMFVARK